MHTLTTKQLNEWKAADAEFARLHPDVYAARKKGVAFAGISLSSAIRRYERNRGTLHTGKPGDVITMSRERKYIVAKDGSFRRMEAA